jgi:hypothetical protein
MLGQQPGGMSASSPTINRPGQSTSATTFLSRARLSASTEVASSQSASGSVRAVLATRLVGRWISFHPGDSAGRTNYQVVTSGVTLASVADYQFLLGWQGARRKGASSGSCQRPRRVADCQPG